jgi:disulfide bond formation protein DsbB
VTSFAKARGIALIVPLALMLGAWGSQYIGGLVPCEMCVWQRWPHLAAIPVAVLAFVVPSRWIVALAALAILTSGAIGFYHAGVEYGWFEGLTTCTQIPGAVSGDLIADIMKAPLVRCDQAQWTLFGISLAGYNALLSGGAALLIFALLGRKTS